eukprot:5418161-Karenia_brevis.AAC.1
MVQRGPRLCCSRGPLIRSNFGIRKFVLLQLRTQNRYALHLERVQKICRDASDIVPWCTSKRLVLLDVISCSAAISACGECGHWQLDY